jgi:hypothetical protein
MERLVKQDGKSIGNGKIQQHKQGKSQLIKTYPNQTHGGKISIQRQ